jgi:hypothetical protein
VDRPSKSAEHVGRKGTNTLAKKTSRSPQHSPPSIFDIDQVTAAERDSTRITYVFGDATSPQLTGSDVLVHVVNDRAVIWGAGFGKAVRYHWPEAQAHFKRWVKLEPNRLRLGEIHLCPISPTFSIVQLIAQHGYGRSPLPRIRYDSLRQCLLKLVEFPNLENSVLHMPRIGCGEAGGDWQKIHPLINEILCGRGIRVVVYTLLDKRLKGEIRWLGK